MNTISRRIYLLAGALLASVALTVALAIYSTGRLVTATERLGRVNLTGIELIQTLGSQFDRLNLLVNSAPAEMDLGKGKLNADEFRKTTEAVKTVIGQLTPLASDAELETELAAILKEIPGFAAGAEKVFKASADFLQQQGIEILQQEVNPVQERIRVSMEKLSKRSLALAAAAPAGITAEARTGQQVIVIVGGLTLLLGSAAGIGVVRRYVVSPLRRLVKDLSENSTQTTESAATVASASQTLAAGSSEQAASVEETSATLEEISSVTKRNADNAQHASQLAGRARATAEGGAKEMQDMSSAVNDIKAASDNIAKIIKTIDEIAFQTNILALNAAVEAARAGEAGMGFAVVADEVRNLAQRAADAARETADKIEHSLSASDRGVQISEKVGACFRDIVSSAREVEVLIAEIATASNEQNTSVAQVGTALGEIEKVTQSSAASAEETSSVAKELNAQAQALRQSVTELNRLVEGTDGVDEEGTSLHPTAGPVALPEPAPRRFNARVNGTNGSAPATVYPSLR